MYTIGQLACLEGVTPKTLRHYEKLELLMPSAHSDSGYRLYSEEDRQKLHEILYYRDLGFPLKAVGEMLRSAEGERRELIEEQISHLGNTIRRCESLRTELLDIREKEKGHGEKTALLIVDMQRDFLENSPLSTPRTARAAENIRKLLDGIRGLGIPVVYICDCHSEDDPELRHWPRHTMKGTAGAEIIDILAPAAGDKVFYKNSFNAFSSGELNPYLHENRDARVLSGVRHGRSAGVRGGLFRRGTALRSQPAAEQLPDKDPFHGRAAARASGRAAADPRVGKIRKALFLPSKNRA